MEPETKLPPGVKEKRLDSRTSVRTDVEVSWTDQQGGIATHQATIVNHSRHGLGLNLQTRTPEDTIVRLRDTTDEVVRAVVRYSRNHELGGWQTGVRVVNRDMRTAGRETVRGSGLLKWPDPRGTARSAEVHVVDISDTGIGVVSPVRVPMSQSVQLVGEQFECFCVVRYCNERSRGDFRLGLLLAREPHDRAHDVSVEWLD